MKRKPFIEDVRQFAALLPALERARQVDCRENDLAVGVCDVTGRVLGVAILDCYLQVHCFSRELRKLGYFPLVVDENDRMQDCDVLFIPA